MYVWTYILGVEFLSFIAFTVRHPFLLAFQSVELRWYEKRKALRRHGGTLISDFFRGKGRCRYLWINSMSALDMEMYIKLFAIRSGIRLTHLNFTIRHNSLVICY